MVLPAPPEAPPDAVLPLHPAITINAATASTPNLASYMYDSSSSPDRLMADDPDRTTRHHRSTCPVRRPAPGPLSRFDRAFQGVGTIGDAGLAVRSGCETNHDVGRRTGGRRSDAVYYPSAT
jgi:hypothetical protein